MDFLRSSEVAHIFDSAQRPEITASFRAARDDIHSALDQCQQEAYFLYVQQVGGPRVAEAFISTENPFNPASTAPNGKEKRAAVPPCKYI